MPFGFGVGDFAAVGKLAWYLYHDCFLVAKGAPQEFRLLVDELKTLHATIKLFEDEFGDPNSVLVRAGEDRLRMVEDLLAQVMHVLNGLREAYDKHRNLGNVSRTSFKRGWDQFKWAVGVKDVEGLRSKLTYLNGLLALLLTCAGNSSLQRLETTTQSIDAGVHGIKTFLKRVGTGDLPIVSAFGATNSPAKIDFSQRCMQAAKVSQRWTLIGIEEWTKAGRWWLLKAHMELRAAARATVPNDAYANLLKASWILTDVIVVHPHMIYIEASVQCDVLRLTEAIKEEFQYIEDKNLRIPSLEDVDDPEIWESQLTSPAMRPGSIAGERTWVMKDEDIIFQRFARYQASYQQIPIPSLVLLLVDKKSRKPRLVVHDQSWRCLAELAAELFPTLKPRHDNIVSIAGVQIILSTTFDAQLLGAFLLGYGLHIIRCTPDFQHSMQVNHDAIFLLAAMMISTVDIVEYFLGILGRSPEMESTSFLVVAVAAAKRFLPPSQPHSAHGEYFPDDHKSLLFTIAKWGYYDVVRQMLTHRGFSPPKLDGLGMWLSPYEVGQRGECDVVQLLLDEGLHIETFIQPPNSGSSPERLLSIVATEGHLAATQLLLDRGADISAGGPLHGAAQNGHVKVVQFLLERGADVSVPNRVRMTPLHLTAYRGYGAIVKLLLDKGADVSVSGAEGRTPLFLAVRGGHEAIVKLLLDKGADVSASDQYRVTPLHAAVQQGYVAVVQLLLEKGADVSVSDLEGSTPLHWAARDGHEAVVQLLLDNGAEVSVSDEEGKTPLHWAALRGHKAVVKLLLDNYADVSVLDEDRMKPLDSAVERGHPTVVQLLLEYGADNGGQPPLCWAAYEGHEATVQFLLDNGADVSVPDENGSTPLCVAAHQGYKAIVHLLVDNGADVSVAGWNERTPLHCAAEKGDKAMVRLLLDKGADVSVACWDGRTPLLCAAGKGDEAIVQLLLDKGADVSVSDEFGRTPLFCAAKSGHKAMVQLLLDNGADVSVAAAVDGETPLCVVAHEGYEAIAQLLLDNGADVSVSDVYGNTPLTWAAGRGHEAMVQLLLDHGADVSVSDHSE